MVISSECGSCVIFCNYVTIAFLAYFMYIARLTQGALAACPYFRACILQITDKGLNRRASAFASFARAFVRARASARAWERRV